MGAFQAIEQSTKVSDIHCVTTWSRYDNRWEGVSTRDLLDLAMPKAEAHYVMLTSYDGYTTNLPLADFAAEDAILATAWEGQPLTARPWRADASCRAASLFLEERQVADPHRADRPPTKPVSGRRTVIICSAIPGASSAIPTTEAPAISANGCCGREGC